MADAILSGTGFEGRDLNISRCCKNGMTVVFKREKNNSFDSNAIAVFLLVPVLFGLLGRRKVSIGWLKKPLARRLALKMDSGIKFTGFVKSFYCPSHIEHPRVSISYSGIK